ncbi:unnamed protein product [Paramecium pentaurelia]|uniref:Transmembrane protein n=1 Tax=Paramecium pentaurelia TaxID=43138 RepID=A0A8S1T4W7_9CILI|nr:unnamed protein product [Paramecium pentaurelia]
MDQKKNCTFFFILILSSIVRKLQINASMDIYKGKQTVKTQAFAFGKMMFVFQTWCPLKRRGGNKRKMLGFCRRRLQSSNVMQILLGLLLNLCKLQDLQQRQLLIWLLHLDLKNGKKITSNLFKELPCAKKILMAILQMIKVMDVQNQKNYVRNTNMIFNVLKVIKSQIVVFEIIKMKKVLKKFVKIYLLLKIMNANLI